MSPGHHRIRIKRIYETPAPDDGLRILIDRLWPRGLRKENAHIDHWLKEIAPSDALRREFGHDVSKWAMFQRRYREELAANPALEELRALAAQNDITLLYAAKDEAHNQAVVLKQVLEESLK